LRSIFLSLIIHNKGVDRGKLRSAYTLRKTCMCSISEPAFLWGNFYLFNTLRKRFDRLCFDKLSNRASASTGSASTSSAQVLRQAQQPRKRFDRLSKDF